jgi:formate dehydrogenase iron-sulfur subunit
MSAAPTEVAVHREGAERMGFFTDTTVCIGCKACEVACKQWNDLPADGYDVAKGRSLDYTGSLSAASWRHVRFLEIDPATAEEREHAQAALGAGAGGHMPRIPAVGELGGAGGGVREDEMVDLVERAESGATATLGDGADALAIVDTPGLGELDRWLFMSDVCKHCTNAGCLDACPTGALIRTEFETVIVQPDICNGCGYCVPSCPFGVIDRDPYDGRAAKCTLCYDRLQDGLEPACAKSCPTDSIQFGPREELVQVARGRVMELHERGLDTAYIYGVDDAPEDQLAGNLGAFFLLTDPPERYGLPAQADSPAQENGPPATAAGLVAAAVAAGSAVVTLVVHHRRGRR